MNELALFAGAGGGILGGKLLGWSTRCAVEIDSYARKVLLARQRDGILEPFPIWDDVATFDGLPWRGSVDVVSGGFPCQDISLSGKGSGIEGEKSGLWSEMVRIIGEVQPRFVFVENSPALTSRGMGRVLGDLATLGFDARWGVFGADSVGADHRRERIYIVAYRPSHGLEGRDSVSQERQREAKGGPMAALRENHVWDEMPAPDAFGDANGVASRVDRLTAIGNGQVPAVVVLAWETLTKGIAT